MDQKRTPPFEGDPERFRQQQMEVIYLSQKYGVEKQVVLDAFNSCGKDHDRIKQYLLERTGKGRGDLGFSHSEPK